jgi:hypothetical protein
MEKFILSKGIVIVCLGVLVVSPIIGAAIVLLFR